MNKESIARACHEINRAYCQSLGDDTQPAWDDAPDWQKASAIAGVDMHLANPDATPEQSHESWLAQKVADGWVYGEVKDADKKEHPCCVPYSELPQEQKAKDYLFRATVHLMKEFVVEEKAFAGGIPAGIPAAAPVKVLPDQVAVQYIGRKTFYKDRLYSTKLEFVPGKVAVLPKEIAEKFLRHQDMFRIAPQGAEVKKEDDKDDTAKALEQAKKAKAKKQEEQSELMDIYDQVNQMDKDALEFFARSKYRHELDKRKNIDTLRKQVVGLIEQYGAV